MKPNEELQTPLQLPCGAVLKNQLARSAMSDSLGDGKDNPTEAQSRLHERWAEGGAAMSIIGEVQCDPRYPEKPGNLVSGAGSDRQAIGPLASHASVQGTHIWPQVGHAGALSHLPISHPKGPSALDVPGFNVRACQGGTSRKYRTCSGKQRHAQERHDSPAFTSMLATDSCSASSFRLCSTAGRMPMADRSRHDAELSSKLLTAREAPPARPFPSGSRSTRRTSCRED